MSKDKSYLYTGTMGHLVATINSLPSDPNMLLKMGWVETTHPTAKIRSNTRTFIESSTGLKINFDKGRPGKPGFRGKDHYHVINPKTTGDKDLYLDKFGNPVAKRSDPSHILP